MNRKSANERERERDSTIWLSGKTENIEKKFFGIARFNGGAALHSLDGISFCLLLFWLAVVVVALISYCDFRCVCVRLNSFACARHKSHIPERMQNGFHMYVFSILNVNCGMANGHDRMRSSQQQQHKKTAESYSRRMHSTYTSKTSHFFLSLRSSMNYKYIFIITILMSNKRDWSDKSNALTSLPAENSKKTLPTIYQICIQNAILIGLMMIMRIFLLQIM